MHCDDGAGSGSQHRGLVSALIAAGTALALAGCSSAGSTSTTSAATAAAAVASASATAATGDPGCTDALHDVSTYGPSTVKLLAEGRETLNKAAVQLLVDGLDGAADAASSPQAKQDIKTLADTYDDYFNLTTGVVAIPLSTLLKDTADVEFICR
jgi:ABC-type Fe3+-hydroxamate transport system substrate-binding protein